MRKIIKTALSGFGIAPALPKTYAAALRLAAEQTEQIEQQAAALAICIAQEKSPTSGNRSGIYAA